MLTLFQKYTMLNCYNFTIKVSSAVRQLKELVSNKPGKKVLLKLNRDHVTKVPRKNRAKSREKIKREPGKVPVGSSVVNSVESFVAKAVPRATAVCDPDIVPSVS